MLVAGAGWITFDFTMYRGETIHRGVMVLGEDLGGLTEDEAETRIAALVRKGLACRLLLKTDDATMTARLGDTGLTLAGGKTAAFCHEVGNLGRLDRRIVDRISLWFRPVEVEPMTDFDPATWDEFADRVLFEFERLPTDAKLIPGQPGLVVIPASAGRTPDLPALRESIRRCVTTGATTVELPLVAVPPSITTAQADAAARAADQAFAAPVSLRYRQKEYRLDPSVLVDMVGIDHEGISSGRPLTFDTEGAREVLQSMLAAIEVHPVDAVIVPISGAGSRGFTVRPSKDGQVVEWDSLLAAITRAVYEPEPRVVAIPTTVAHPKLTTVDAEQLGLRREISSFTTYFSPDNLARVHNIQQVAAILDGAVVRPGQVFSFNAVVGPRTRAAGFDEAPIIRAGVLVPGVGGGICQASTTLFNAVFIAGLPVIERHPHSLYIDHYPIGRDAAVAYGSQDFRFRNDTDQIIVISATATEKSLTVSLAAPQWDRTVGYSTSSFRDVVKPSSSPEKPRRVRDPALAPGTESPLEPGIDGRSVDVYRTVSSADGTVLFKDSFSSTYQPKDFLIRVGPPE